MIARIARHGLEVGPPEVLADARERFTRNCCVLLPGFLPTDLLTSVQRLISAARWQQRVHGLISNTDPPRDLVLEGHDIDGRLLFLVNDSRMFHFVESITGCDPIGYYRAAVYMMVPGQGHVDAWHSDDDGNRMVALSLNLGDAPYEGGVLQLKDCNEDRIIHEVHNTGAGDAILFQISSRLDHRVTEVTGTVPKMALAGWFQRRPVFQERFPRRAIAPSGPPQ